MFWAYSAIIRTLSYLASKADDLKYSLMRCFGVWMVLYYLAVFLLLVTFLLAKLFDNAQEVLLTVAEIEQLAFASYTVTLVIFAMIFRPNDNSLVIG